ncbi:breast cancer type 1 susceptibility protein-like, partial [Homarus americanus]
IHQVVKGPRSSAQCPLCLAHITRRSLDQNNKITSLVAAVRKIISSIKKDCCFEVTPSKYRPRPRPTITAEDDDSENEENDEPRRGTRKRGVTAHYNPEVYIPKPRARSAKQRILTSNGGQELSLHTDGKPQTQRADAGISDCIERVIVDVISQEHSYSSPTKQEPLERKSLIPSLTRGKGARGGGVVLRGRGRLTGGGTRGGHSSLIGKSARNSRRPIATYLGKKEINTKTGGDLLSVSQQIENTIVFPGESLNYTEESSQHLSEKLGREKPTDKVAKWLHTSSEVGFRIGASHSSDSLLKSDSESTQYYIPPEKDVGKDLQSSAQTLMENKSSSDTSIKKSIHTNKESCSSSTPKSKGSITTSFIGSKKFFKSKDGKISPVVESQDDVETQIFNPAEYMTGTPSDPYNFIPSQRTPKNTKIAPKRGRGVKSRARGALSMTRGRVRGRGRGQGTPIRPEGFDRIDDSIISTSMSVNLTYQKQSTPVTKGAKLKQNVNLSVIKPPKITINFAGKKQIDSVIMSNHDDDDDDHHDIPDSCPVNTENEFDVLVSDVKENKTCNSSQVADPLCNNIIEEDKEANLIFVTPAEGGRVSAAVDVTTGTKAEVKKGGKKRPNEDTVGVNEGNKKTKKKQTISDVEGSSSSSSSNRSQTARNKRSKAEKAQKEVEALCSMFEDIEQFELNTVFTKEEELNKQKRIKERESLLRENISFMEQTFENTQINKTIPSKVSKGENVMPPPKVPTRNRKVRFNANTSVEQNEPHTCQESTPSVSTRSSGKILTNNTTGCTSSHNVRYASEMKSKFIDTNKTVAVLVNVKNAKSPGWSHVEGARKDLKIRQTSLNITGGEQRSMNDSRTDGGTCGHSVNTITSSQETDVTIDEETQQFDVEHLSSSHSKTERVKKLKNIVSQMRLEEENKKAQTKLKKTEKTREISCRENIEHDKNPQTSQILQSDKNTKDNKIDKPQSTNLPEVQCSETEPFCTDEQVEGNVSYNIISSRTSVKFSLQSLLTNSKKDDSIPTKCEDQNDNLVENEEKDSSLPSRRTFSLTANTQDLSVLNSDCESAGKPPSVKPPCVSFSLVEDLKEISDVQSNSVEPLRKVVTTSASSSTVMSKPRPPHHAMSPSSTPGSSSKTFLFPKSDDPLQRNMSFKTSQTSPSCLSSSKNSSTDSQVIHGSRLVPFKSMGSLCSERKCCSGTVVSKTEKAVMQTDLQAAANSCGDEEGNPNDKLTPQQCEAEAQTLSESAASEKKNVEPESHLLEETQVLYGSEMVPGSCCTEDMEVALSFPVNIGIKTCTRKNFQSTNTLTEQVAENSELNLNIDKKGSNKSKKSTDTQTRVEDSSNGQTPAQSSSPSSEIPLDKCALKRLTSYIESSSANLNQNTESQQSTSLLAVADISENKLTRAARISSLSSENVKMDEKPAERTERRTQGAQKTKERGMLPRTVINDEELVEVEKENLKNTGNLQPTINRPRRKPLQSGQPVLENIMSQVSKDGKIPPIEKDELTPVQRSQESQKTVNSQNKATNSKLLFSTDSSDRSNTKGKKDDLLTLGSVENRDPDNSGDDSPCIDNLDSSNRRFKRIRMPTNSDSSSEESDTEVIMNPPKRKPKIISTSSSNSSAVQKSQKTKFEKPELFPLDSEEMRDLERLDQNVWEFFGHPDEDLMDKKDDDQNSHTSIEDVNSQKIKSVVESDDAPLTTLTIPSDEEEIPSTAEVLRNVNQDLNLIKSMRKNKKKIDLEIITLGSSQDTLHSANVPSLSLGTKMLFARVNKSLSKAEALLDENSTTCKDKNIPLEEQNSTKAEVSRDKKPGKKSPSDKADIQDGQPVKIIEESDEEHENEVDNVSHSSVYSNQSEAISTQKQNQVKAKVRELEAAMKKKDVVEEDDDPNDVLSPTCPLADDSGEESEELFTSLPELTVSNEPKLPPSNDPIISQKPASSTTRVSTRGPPQLVCTGLTASEMGKVQDLVNKLASPGSSVKRLWDTSVTHVVVKTESGLHAQRTLKYLFGIAAGCWVITLQWVLDSLSTKKLLPEEDYEVIDCTGVPGPNKGRTKLIPLFTNCEFYVMPPFVDVTIQQFRELIKLCGAQIVDSPLKFSENNRSMKLIIVQTDGSHHPEETLKKYEKPESCGSLLPPTFTYARDPGTLVLEVGNIIVIVGRPLLGSTFNGWDIINNQSALSYYNSCREEDRRKLNDHLITYLYLIYLLGSAMMVFWYQPQLVYPGYAFHPNSND